MSSYQGGRVPLDFYETPEWQVNALTQYVEIRGRCYEPCVGNGAIVRALPMLEWMTNDIDPGWPAERHTDATDPDSWDRLSYSPDWVITNPPFNRALPIVQEATLHARYGVAMILRLSWLEPTRQRASFLSNYPPNLLIVMPRHRYNPNRRTTDSVTTAWMVWYNWAATRRHGIIVHPNR